MVTKSQAYLSDISSTFADSAFTIENAVSPTRRARFDAAGISLGTTRLYDLPNVDGTLALDFGDFGFMAFMGGPQIIPDSTLTVVNFTATAQTNGGNNPGGHYDTSTGLYTVPATGLYMISATVEFGSNGVGSREMQLSFNTGVGDQEHSPSASGATYLTMTTARLSVWFTPSTLAVEVTQTSGGPLVVQSGYFGLSYLGPLP